MKCRVHNMRKKIFICTVLFCLVMVTCSMSGCGGPETYELTESDIKQFYEDGYREGYSKATYDQAEGWDKVNGKWFQELIDDITSDGGIVTGDDIYTDLLENSLIPEVIEPEDVKAPEDDDLHLNVYGPDEE